MDILLDRSHLVNFYYDNPFINRITINSEGQVKLHLSNQDTLTWFSSRVDISILDTIGGLLISRILYEEKNRLLHIETLVGVYRIDFNEFSVKEVEHESIQKDLEVFMEQVRGLGIP